MFRDLRADEIDVRISTANKNGVSLLLYKNARCDQNILDETVGAMNWQRRHTKDNANCIVSLWDDKKQQWIEKEDTGTESNTEAEKGLASDSFKRACFNWGIGRELYTSPFIWVAAENLKTLKSDDGKRWKCNDSFSVDSIEIENKRITALKIRNTKTGAIVTDWKNNQRNTRLICEDCGEEIKAFNAEWSAERVAAKNKADYGRMICVDCAKKRKRSN